MYQNSCLVIQSGIDKGKCHWKMRNQILVIRIICLYYVILQLRMQRPPSFANTNCWRSRQRMEMQISNGDTWEHGKFVFVVTLPILNLLHNRQDKDGVISLVRQRYQQDALRSFAISSKSEQAKVRDMADRACCRVANLASHFDSVCVAQMRPSQTTAKQRYLTTNLPWIHDNFPCEAIR